jgi:opine dehydrogenase
VISLFPDNFGALVLRNMMRKQGCKAKVIIGGWSSMPYGVRIVEPGKVDCIMRIRNLCGDALPGADGRRFFEVMRGIPAFDGIVEIKRADTILAVDLENRNPVVHVPGSILNVGAMEVSEMQGIFGIPKGKYSMYQHGMSPAVSRVQYAFYREECRIAGALGIKTEKHSEEEFYWKGSIMGKEYWVPFVDVIMPPIVGPDSITHRYFTEDIPVGTVARYHLARKFGVEVPVIESLIRVGSAICGRDFIKEGLSLEDLGIADMSRGQIIKYVRGRVAG